MTATPLCRPLAQNMLKILLFGSIDDDNAIVGILYNGQPILFNGQPILFNGL